MTARTPDDAAKQLRRLLIAIPALADDSPHSISDLAAMVGVSEKVLARDLRTLVTRVGPEPGGFMEKVRLAFASDTVQLDSRLLRRPMGLTPGELGALELGLTALALELPPHEAAVATRARGRVAEAATSLDADLRGEGAHAVRETASEGDALHLSLLRNAISARRKAAVLYRSGSATQESTRNVHPYGLVYANGKWYLLAHCDKADDLRIFRIDRMRAVTVLDEVAIIPENLDLQATLRDGRAIVSHSEEVLQVQYSAKIARWIVEHEEGKVQPDGSLIVEHPLLDDEWAVRHVLQYGPEARVLEPLRIREMVRARVEAVLAQE